MKSALETLSPTRVKLTVEVPFEELKPALDAAYKRIAAQVNIPGFRKGKVPNRIIDQRVGRAAVLDEAINDALNTNLDSALRENEIKLLGRPEVDVTTFEDAAPLLFTAEMDVVPEFDLPAFDTIEVTVDAAEVTEADVDTQLDGLRARFGSLKAVERAATKGDVLLFDISGDNAGTPVEDLVAQAMSYELGTEGMLPGFDDALEGASAGETRTFAFTPEAGEFSGQELSVSVTVATVRERELPTADDSFAQLASEFDTIAELRTDLSERLARVKLLEQGYAARDKVAAALLAATEVPIPEGAIKQQVDEHFVDGHGDEGHRAEFETEARDALKPARPRQDRQHGAAFRRRGRALGVARPAGTPLWHEPRPVRPGARQCRPGALSGGRGAPWQGAGPRARERAHRRHQWRRDRPRVTLNVPGRG